MKKILLVCFAWSSMYFCCEKERVPVPGLPGCLQQRIQQIRQQPKWNPPAEIHEYRYNGQTVYLVSADCCDQFTTLIDASCNTLCAPSGGVTGKGDQKCTDFAEKAQHVRLVWKDNRR